jgi:hypothetical protein
LTRGGRTAGTGRHRCAGSGGLCARTTVASCGCLGGRRRRLFTIQETAINLPIHKFVERIGKLSNLWLSHITLLQHCHHNVALTGRTDMARKWKHNTSMTPIKLRHFFKASSKPSSTPRLTQADRIAAAAVNLAPRAAGLAIRTNVNESPPSWRVRSSVDLSTSDISVCEPRSTVASGKQLVQLVRLSITFYFVWTLHVNINVERIEPGGRHPSVSRGGRSAGSGGSLARCARVGRT